MTANSATSRTAIARPRRVAIWRRHWAASLLAAVDRASRAAAGDPAPRMAAGIRRAMKETEALLRLAPKAIAAAAEALRREAGDIRRSLGETRDAAVAVERLAAIEPPTAVALAHRRLLRALAGNSRAAAKTTIAPARRAGLGLALARLRAGIARLPAEGGDGFVLRGLVRAYRGAWRAMPRELRRAGVGEVHGFRKRVVILRHLLAFVAPAWPGAIGPLAKEAQKLRDCLGEANDLAVLAAVVRDRAGAAPAPGHAVIEAMIARARRKALGRGARRAPRIFPEAPGAFSARFAAYLDHAGGGLRQRTRRPETQPPMPASMR